MPLTKCPSLQITAMVHIPRVDPIHELTHPSHSWVTLVNATQSDLGSCLGLSTFSTLVVQGSNGSFATAVDDYLVDMCGGTKCDSTTMKYWKYKIEKDCSAGNDLKQPLLKTLGVVMNNYESSLYDLACKVH